MKNWMKPELTELNIHATAQEPTVLLETDEYVPGVNEGEGYFKQGTGKESGPQTTVPYFPGN